MGPGLLLLTGGSSRRLGAPKHLEIHPGGGTWAGHIVAVFRNALGQGPIRILGPGVMDYPEYPPILDDGSGPALALSRWAKGEREACTRWWIAPCDQVRWTAGSLLAWHRATCEADPAGNMWAAAVTGGRPQPMGGFLGGRTLDVLGQAAEARILALWERLPHLELPWEGDEFEDVDDPAAREAWLQGRQEGR